jgi:hypothetical protein
MADRIITDFVSELKSVLHLKKTVVFPGLGRLRATKENNVFFVADEDLDIYPDGFGLEPVSLKTNQETPEDVSAAVEGLKSLLDPEPVPEPTPEPEPVVEPESTPESVPEPTPAPEPEPAPESEQPVVPAAPKSKAWRKVLWTILALVLVAAVLFGVFVLISRVNPEMLDSVLYTKEELEIINWQL